MTIYGSSNQLMVFMNQISEKHFLVNCLALAYESILSVFYSKQ